MKQQVRVEGVLEASKSQCRGWDTPSVEYKAQNAVGLKLRTAEEGQSAQRPGLHSGQHGNFRI